MATREALTEPKFKILVAQFIHESAEVFKRILEMSGYHAFVAQDGQDVVEKASEIRPDLIILDMHLTVIDGLRASQMIKSDEASRDIPIIMVSALEGAAAKEAAFSAGASHYFLKPFDVDELLERINSIFEGIVTAPEWEN